MFSLLHKKEGAHEEGIWSCCWGKTTTSDRCPGNEDIESNFKDPKSINQNDRNVFIVTGGMDDLVKVWDIQNDGLSLRHELSAHSLGVVSVVASADGKMIASSSLDSGLCFWDSVSGNLDKQLSLGPEDIWTLDFSPCDKFIISGSHNGKITMYDVKTGLPLQVLDPQNGKFTLSIAYSPDGKYIATGAIDGIINIFDVTTGKVAQTLEGHAMPVRSLCFSPDSELLLTASDDGHMKLYDVVHCDIAGTVSGHASWVLCVTFSSDGKRFASSSSDKTVKIWDFGERKSIHTFSEHNDQVWSVKYSFDNDKLISVGEDKTVNLYKCPNNVI